MSQITLNDIISKIQEEQTASGGNAGDQTISMNKVKNEDKFFDEMADAVEEGVSKASGNQNKTRSTKGLEQKKKDQKMSGLWDKLTSGLGTLVAQFAMYAAALPKLLMDVIVAAVLKVFKIVFGVLTGAGALIALLMFLKDPKGFFEVVQSIFDFVKGIIVSVFEFIMGEFELIRKMGLWEYLKKRFWDIYNFFTETFFPWIFETAIPKAWEWISWLFTKAWEGISSLFVAIWEKIWESRKTILLSISDLVLNIGKKILEIGAWFVKWYVTLWHKVAMFIWDGIFSLLDYVFPGIKDYWDTNVKPVIDMFFNNVIYYLSNLGELWNVMVDVANSFWDIMKGIMSWITDSWIWRKIFGEEPEASKEISTSEIQARRAGKDRNTANQVSNSLRNSQAAGASIVQNTIVQSPPSNRQETTMLPVMTGYDMRGQEPTINRTQENNRYYG